ncbi:MAG: PHP-associated domain-containing protein [Acidobacteriota bacterium]
MALDAAIETKEKPLRSPSPTRSLSQYRTILVRRFLLPAEFEEMAKEQICWATRMAGWLKADLHLHTCEDPHDGQRMVVHTPAELIQRAADQGFRVLSITNHNQLLYSRELAEYAERLGVLLIPGVEATLNGRHVLLYNFMDYRPSWNSALFDAVELSSLSLRGLDFNRRAAREAKRRGLPLVGNSDTHFLYQLGRTYTLIHADFQVTSVLRAIRSGHVRAVSQPNGAWFVSRFFVESLRWRLLHAMRGSRPPVTVPE